MDRKAERSSVRQISIEKLPTPLVALLCAVLATAADADMRSAHDA
jgi:hypothetical protein